MNILREKLRAMPRSLDLVDKLLAAKQIHQVQANNLRDIKEDWANGEIATSSQTVQEVLSQEINALNFVPRTTFRDWLGKKGITNVSK